MNRSPLRPPASTYYSVVLAYGQHEERHVTVLFHRHLPLLALVDHPPNGLEDLPVTDDPVVANATPGHSAFRLLAPGQLAAPATPASLSKLAFTELKQIAYWKPKTVSEVLFNLWDLR